MSLNYENLCEDWGWYIDIENTNHLNNLKTNFTNIPNKKFSIHLNKLHTINESEYDDKYGYYNMNISKHLNEETPEKTNKNEDCNFDNVLNIRLTIMITTMLIGVINIFNYYYSINY